MNKPELHYIWVKIRAVKVWYLLVPLVISSGLTVTALRSNNLGMVERRDAVYKADKDNKDVEGALQSLRSYVYAHMNTKLTTENGVYPPIQLKHTYTRLQDAEKARVASANSNLYSEAQTTCEAQNPTGFSGRGRIPCIEAYVTEHTQKEKTIPAAMYKFNFVSPSWSPDLAGYSLLATFGLAILLTLRLLAGKVLPRLTK